MEQIYLILIEYFHQKLNLDEKEYNFITTVDRTKDNYIFAYSDLTTGENFLTTLPINDDILQAEILKLKSKEIGQSAGKHLIFDFY